MVGGSKSRPSAPSSFAYSAHFFAVCHPVPCAPAMTIPRPATAFTATWMTLRRSSSVSASYSPRDPFGPTPRHPLFIRKSQCSANLSKSTVRVRVILEWYVLRKRAQQVFNGAPAHPALTYPKPGAATQLQCAEGLRL